MKPFLHLALFVSSIAAGQQPSPELTQTLEHLGAAAATLTHSLPSFACQETVVSQRLHGKNVEQQANFTASLRVNRAADGSLSESYTLTTLNGSPFTGGSFSIPVYVAGGFDRAMLYFSPTLQSCFHYHLSQHRIDFESTSDATCEFHDMHGFALLDDAGNVTHLERSISPGTARYLGLADFAAFDFDDVNLNGRTYRISRHLLAQVSQGRDSGRFDATYTNCHLFAATVTIGPSTEVPPADQTSPQ